MRVSDAVGERSIAAAVGWRLSGAAGTVGMTAMVGADSDGGGRLLPRILFRLRALLLLVVRHLLVQLAGGATREYYMTPVVYDFYSQAKRDRRLVHAKLKDRSFPRHACARPKYTVRGHAR